MNEESKDKSLDDFINELKKSSERMFNQETSSIGTSSTFEYERPDWPVQNNVVMDQLQVKQAETSETLIDIQKKQAGFSEQLTHLNQTVNAIPGQVSAEVIHKVEQFLNYHTAKIEERLKASEERIESERKLIQASLNRVGEPVNQPPVEQPNYRQPRPNYEPPYYREPVPPPYEPPYARPQSGMQEYIRQEMLKESNESIKMMQDRMKKSEDLLIHYIDKNDKQIKELFGQAIPKWVYILNMVFLAGIFLFLVNHFFSNYSIQMKQAVQQTPVQEISNDNQEPAVVNTSKPTRSVELLPTVRTKQDSKQVLPADVVKNNKPELVTNTEGLSEQVVTSYPTKDTNVQEGAYLASDE